MAIGIKGLRIDKIDIVTVPDEGDEKVAGSYSIISTKDKVIAKQNFNGFNDIKITMSSGTKEVLGNFIASIKKDAENSTGLTE